MTGQYRDGFRYEWNNGGVEVSPLVPSLLGYWQLDEASGTRADVAGNHPLTDNNTVGQAPGIIVDAATPTAANQEWLSSADNFDLNADFTVQAWVYPELLAGGSPYGRGVVVFLQGVTLRGSWMIGVQSDGRISCYHFRQILLADATGRHNTTATGLTPLATWTHIVFRRDTGVYTIWVNGVSQGYTDASTDSGWGTGGLMVGRLFDTVDTSYYWSGRIDELAVWDSALTDGQIAQLYNGGVGLTFPFL